MFSTWMETDLASMVTVRKFGNIFSKDNMANLIGVKVTAYGLPVELEGNVTVSVIRPDGETITVAGEKEENTAWVILPADAYDKVGRIQIFIKMTTENRTVTIGAVEGKVYQTMTI